VVCFREMDEETNISSNTVLICTSITLLCFVIPVAIHIRFAYFIGFDSSARLKT